MLDIRQPSPASHGPVREHFGRLAAADEGSAGSSVGLFDLLHFLKRRKWLIGFLGLVGLVIAFVVLALATPVYTASTRLLIDTRHQDSSGSQSDDGIILDSSAIDSQIELIKSRIIAEKTARALNLQDVPAFNGTWRSPADAYKETFWNWLGYPPPPSMVLSEEQRRRIAIGAVGGGVSASRVGRSYVIQISFSSTDPVWAAKVANALGDAYVEDQLDATYTATQRAGAWMQTRIDELRGQANLAEREVLRYRAEHNIIDVGQGGTLANEQLNDAAQQMMRSRAEVAEARVRLDRVTEIMNSSSNGEMPDETVSEINSNPIIQRLRSSYVDIQKREADISSRFGRDHVQAVALRNEMRGLQDSMLNELRRVVETVRSDYQIAVARDEATKSAFEDFVKRSTASREAQIPLRELEATAQSYRGLYDTFLNQQAQANQRISFPKTEARVIAPANVPWAPASPNVNRIAMFGLLGGLMAGLGAAFAREQLDRVFRTPQQVEKVLGVECLGILPVVPGKVDRSASNVADKHGFAKRYSIMTHVVEQPFSRFSETLRGIKVTIDLSGALRASHCLGFVSGMPNEGKTTVACNFATLIAASGQQAILVDLDLRNPSLSRRLAPNATIGVLEVIRGQATLDEALFYDPATKLYFLPVAGGTARLNSGDILGSAQMESLVASLRAHMPYVILDLPPLSPVVDARAAVAFVDSFVMVVEWGKSRFDVMQEALKNAPEVREKLLGAVLNKTNLRLLMRYDGQRDLYYDSKYYKRYGYEG